MIALHVAVIIMYISVHIQSLRTFRKSQPSSNHLIQLKSIVPDSTTTTSFSILPAPAPRETPPTENEKIEALRVLSAGNALVGLITFGIIAMQLGQDYAKRQEKEQREIDLRTAATSAAGTTETKKDI